MARLQSDPKYLNFQKVTVLTVDETKPRRPSLTVEVTLAGGATEVIPASTPFFTFLTDDGPLTATASACGHIQALHQRDEDLGGRFELASLEEIFAVLAERLPAGVATAPGVSSFVLDAGRRMGTDGVATLRELLADGVLSHEDIAAAEALRQQVVGLNRGGDLASKQAFFAVQDPAAKVRFLLVRGSVVVPTVAAPRRPTSNVFVVFGPGEGQSGKTLYTATPGRWMPRHPNPAQFGPEEGGADGPAFAEAARAWFDSVMLTH